MKQRTQALSVIVNYSVWVTGWLAGFIPAAPYASPMAYAASGVYRTPSTLVYWTYIYQDQPMAT